MNNMKLRFRNGLGKAFTMSYDDGVEQDVRLIELMRKNGIKGTFNLSAGCFAKKGIVYPTGQVHRRMDKDTCISVYQGNDIEVAIHGYTHPFLEAVPAPTAMMEIIRDRTELEEAFGCIIRGMAYPYGTYDDHVVDILRMAGIAYSRTVEARANFDIPKDWLRMGATCHHNHPKLNELLDIFVNETPTARQDAFLFYLWGHSYEFEGDDNWQLIESFLEKIGGRSNVWYATNIEIVDYVNAFRSLIFSVHADSAYNPSAIDVWAQVDNRVVHFPAGKTVKL